MHSTDLAFVWPRHKKRRRGPLLNPKATNRPTAATKLRGTGFEEHRMNGYAKDFAEL
jgi:hypothetical protein